MQPMKMLICLMVLMNHVDAKMGVRSRPITSGSKIARLKQLCYLYNEPSVEFCEKNYPSQEEVHPNRLYEVATIIVMLLMLVMTLIG